MVVVRTIQPAMPLTTLHLQGEISAIGVGYTATDYLELTLLKLKDIQKKIGAKIENI